MLEGSAVFLLGLGSRTHELCPGWLNSVAAMSWFSGLFAVQTHALPWRSGADRVRVLCFWREDQTAGGKYIRHVGVSPHRPTGTLIKAQGQTAVCHLPALVRPSSCFSTTSSCFLCDATSPCTSTLSWPCSSSHLDRFSFLCT